MDVGNYDDLVENNQLTKEEENKKENLNSDLICSNFTEMSDNEFYDCLEWANKKLMKKVSNRKQIARASRERRK